MIWDDILIRFRNIISPSEKRIGWFENLVQNLEQNKKNGTTVYFKIVRPTSAGFRIKVGGVNGFLAFKYMPWKYPSLSVWTMIAPMLVDKVYSCTIHDIKNEPVSVLINATSHKFQEPHFTIGEKYPGIIVFKNDKFIQVDFGYFFKWKHGAIIQIIEQNHFEPASSFSACRVGTIIAAQYFGSTNEGERLFGLKKELTDWKLQVPQKLLGKNTWALAYKNPHLKNQVCFKVQDRYKCKIYRDIDSDVKPDPSKIAAAKQLVKPGDKIQCKVMAISEKNQELYIEWLNMPQLDDPIDKSIKNNIDTKTINQLEQLKKSLILIPSESPKSDL
jgi:hypothetical protein